MAIVKLGQILRTQTTGEPLDTSNGGLHSVPHTTGGDAMFTDADPGKVALTGHNLKQLDGDRVQLRMNEAASDSGSDPVVYESYTVPQGKCMIVQYISAYTYLEGEPEGVKRVLVQIRDPEDNFLSELYSSRFADFGDGAEQHSHDSIASYVGVQLEEGEQVELAVQSDNSGNVRGTVSVIGQEVDA